MIFQTAGLEPLSYRLFWPSAQRHISLEERGAGIAGYGRGWRDFGSHLLYRAEGSHDGVKDVFF